MAYNAANPADTQTIAAGPNDIRTNFEGLRGGQIVDAGALKGLIPGNATGNIPISNGTVCTNLNAEKVGGNLPAAFATAGHTHPVATASSAGYESATDKAKLDGIAAGAEVNQMAFSNVLVGSTTIQADSETDTLTLIAGTNIALTPDAANDAVTIGITGTVANATTAGACTGNAATATKLATARAISFTGDATGSVNFDGSAAASGSLTLAASGVPAGTYKSVTVDGKGRVTAGTNPTTGAYNASAITNVPAGNIVSSDQQSVNNEIDSKLGAGVGNKNKIINGGFLINQRAYVSGTAKAAGLYMHDRFKAGASGCTYTFTQVNAPKTTINITTGSLQQIIEGLNIEGGTYVLSWKGTTQARINGGTYVSSPAIVTGLTGGNNVTVEFNTGTLGEVQFEPGVVATPFEQRNVGIELFMCQRYFELGWNTLASSLSPWTPSYSYKTAKYSSSPALIIRNYDNGTGGTIASANAYGFYQNGAHSISSGFSWSSEAEI